MTYLLDSSAWLTHLFGEPSLEEINRIFADLRAEVCISVLSLPEVFGRLRALEKTFMLEIQHHGT